MKNYISDPVYSNHYICLVYLAMWNCAVLPLVVGICRVTPRTVVLVYVSTIIFLISQKNTKPVCI